MYIIMRIIIIYYYIIGQQYFYSWSIFTAYFNAILFMTNINRCLMADMHIIYIHIAGL